MFVEGSRFGAVQLLLGHSNSFGYGLLLGFVVSFAEPMFLAGLFDDHVPPIVRFRGAQPSKLSQPADGWNGPREIKRSTLRDWSRLEVTTFRHRAPG